VTGEREHATTIPHREKYLLLNARLARHVLDAYDRWLDEVDEELGSPSPAGRRR
jgi:hypothetical protein